MNPKIDKTFYGSITIEGVLYEHDVLILLSGGKVLDSGGSDLKDWLYWFCGIGREPGG